MLNGTSQIDSIQQVAEEAERREELNKVATSQEMDRQSNSDMNSDGSNRSTSDSRQEHDTDEGKNNYAEEAPKTPVSVRQDKPLNEVTESKMAAPSTIALADGDEDPAATAAATASGVDDSSAQDVEVEAALAMEHVRCLTESLYEEMLRHHDLEVHEGDVLGGGGSLYLIAHNE